MAKRLSIPSRELQLVVVGPRDSFKASRVQSLNINSDVPSTLVSEIGSATNAGSSTDTPNITLTFSAFDVGIEIFATLTGKDPRAYPAGGASISELSEIDAIIYVKSDTVSDYVRTIHARRLQIRDFSFNYSVDGESTEEYNAVGSRKRFLAYDVVVDKFTNAGTSFTLNQTPVQLKNGNYGLSVIVDGKYFTETTGTPGEYEYKLLANKSLTLGTAMVNQVLVVYHANPAGNNWADVADTYVPAAIRGRDVLVRLAANNVPRVQSITINGNLNPTAVREMGNKDGIVGYQKQIPTIEGTLTVLETDHELINLLLYGTTTTSGVVEWEVGSTCLTSGVALSIQLLDPCDDTSPYTVLKEIYLDQINVNGDGQSINVGGDLQTQFNFRSLTGRMVVYSGARVG